MLDRCLAKEQLQSVLVAVLVLLFQTGQLRSVLVAVLILLFRTVQLRAWTDVNP